VHRLTFLGRDLLASLDVSGSIHAWTRTSGASAHVFEPAEAPELPPLSPASLLPERPLVSAGTGTAGGGDAIADGSGGGGGTAAVVAPLGLAASAGSGGSADALLVAPGRAAAGAAGGAAAGAPAGVAAVVQLGMGCQTGYTCLAAAPGDGEGAGGGGGEGRPLLLAGSADGRVCWLDAAAGLLVSEFAVPGVAASAAAAGEPGTEVVGAVAAGAGCVAAGDVGGGCALLDARCGVVRAAWRAHEAAVTQLGFVGAAAGGQLLSCSQDGTLKLWDLRYDGGGGSGGTATPLGGGQRRRGLPLFADEGGAEQAAAAGDPWRLQRPQVSSTWRARREGVQGFVVHSGAVVARCGALIGVGRLGEAAPGALQLTPLRNAQGGPDRGTIVALGLLACSKLLVVADAEGRVRLCV
jgi:hypothetical protein